jgi:hypothetical protein
MVIASFLLAVLLPGCTPNCEKVCKRLHECERLGLGDTPEGECVLNCQLQENAYEAAEVDDSGLSDDFDGLKSCIVDATCADLGDGVCYDSALYSY